MKYQNAALLLLPILMAITLAMAPPAETGPRGGQGVPDSTPNSNGWATPECNGATGTQFNACLEKYGSPGPVGAVGPEGPASEDESLPSTEKPTHVPLGMEGWATPECKNATYEQFTACIQKYGPPGPVGSPGVPYTNTTNSTSLANYDGGFDEEEPENRKPFEIGYLISVPTNFPDLQNIDSTENDFQLQKDSLEALRLINFETTKRGYLLPKWESLESLGVTQIQETHQKDRAFDMVQLVSHIVLAIQETHRRIDALEQTLQATPKTTVV